MSSIRMASLVAAGLMAGINTVSAADVALKLKQTHDQVTDNRRQRSSNRNAAVLKPHTEVSSPNTEALFREFLEWLKRQ